MSSATEPSTTFSSQVMEVMESAMLAFMRTGSIETIEAYREQTTNMKRLMDIQSAPNLHQWLSDAWERHREMKCKLIQKTREMILLREMNEELERLNYKLQRSNIKREAEIARLNDEVLKKREQNEQLGQLNNTLRDQLRLATTTTTAAE